MIAITHLLVRAVQHWLFAQSFNLILLQKKADQRNIAHAHGKKDSGVGCSCFKSHLILNVLELLSTNFQ